MENKQNGIKITEPQIKFSILIPCHNDLALAPEIEDPIHEVIKLRRESRWSGISVLLNRGLKQAQNEWIILTTHPLFLRSNFLEAAREDVECLRDAYQGDAFVLTGQTLREEEKHERWNNYIQGYQSRFHTTQGPIRVPFLILNKKIIMNINGLDERYDMGSGYHIENLTLRLSVLGLPIILDQYLMAYSFKLDEDLPSIATNALLWEYDKYEIVNGKIRAFNSI